MEPVEVFVRNPVKVAVGVLLVALFGSIALLRMPMQLTPEVQIPTISVETVWPGASPQEIEREIVQQQEEQLKSVEGLTKLSSESSDSRGNVTMEFVVGTDMDSALLKVNARLQQVREYPEDAQQPVISTSSSSGTPIGWFILGPLVPERDAVQAFAVAHPATAAALAPVLAADSIGLRMARLRAAVRANPDVAPLLPLDQDIPKLRRLAEDAIEARFERVPGVSNSNVFGGRIDEMRVIVDPARLAARGLAITDVREALRGRNQDTSGGDFWEGKRRYVVRTLGQFDSPESVAGLVLTEQDGVPVYVRDVADVELGFKKADSIVRSFGETSIAVNCQRETGANVLDVMHGLREATRELNAGVLAARGLQLKQVYDETDYIYSSIRLVNQNIVVALDPAAAGDLVFPMLHYDTNDNGIYEFTVVEGADGPVFVAGEVVVGPLEFAAAAPAEDTGESAAPPGACTVTRTGGNANLRTGPSTAFAVPGVLADGESAVAVGQAQGSDGVWWNLDNGFWVRSDIVSEDGDCESLPTVDAPAAPAGGDVPAPAATEEASA